MCSVEVTSVRSRSNVVLDYIVLRSLRSKWKIFLVLNFLFTPFFSPSVFVTFSFCVERMLPVDRILFQIRSIPRVKRSRDFLGDTSRGLVDHTELLLFSSQEVQPMLRNPLIFTLPEAQKIPKPTENEGWRGNVMPSSKFSSEAAKSAAKVTYTIAPLPAKTKNPIPSLPAISPQIGTISRSYHTRLPAKLTTVSLVGRWVCLILCQVSCLHVSWCLYLIRTYFVINFPFVEEIVPR